MYKNRGVVLSSIQNHWKGRAGYQQWPWVATIGDQAVFTRSGNPKTTNKISNSNLPYIEQKDNVALIMYRPNKDLSTLGRKNTSVALHWQKENFDKVVRWDKWVIGTKGDNYIGIRMHCVKTINGFSACDTSDGQTWVVIVGNKNTHKSFANFQNIIKQSKYAERFVFDYSALNYIYHGEININGKKIVHRWQAGDGNSINTNNTTNLESYMQTQQESVLSLSSSSLLNNNPELQTLHTYPNPFQAWIHIQHNTSYSILQEITATNLQ